MGRGCIKHSLHRYKASMKGVDQPESASTLGGVRCRTRVVLTHTLTLSFSHRGDLSIQPWRCLEPPPNRDGPNSDMPAN